MIRYYVAPLNSSQPHYLGHAMKFWAQEYNWANAGYVLSISAVQLLLSSVQLLTLFGLTLLSTIINILSNRTTEQ